MGGSIAIEYLEAGLLMPLVGALVLFSEERVEEGDFGVLEIEVFSLLVKGDVLFW